MYRVPLPTCVQQTRGIFIALLLRAEHKARNEFLLKANLSIERPAVVCCIERQLRGLDKPMSAKLFIRFPSSFHRGMRIHATRLQLDRTDSGEGEYRGMYS